MTPQEILIEATLRKIRLTPHGPERLIATCHGPLPDDIKPLLIENKPAIWKLLMAKRNLARQVLNGEFSPLDDRLFGLICGELVVQYHDEICRRAYEHLRAVQSEKNSK